MSASIIGRILGLALAMAVVLSLGVAVVEAAIPNNGTYYACLTKKTGAVKVINYPKVQCAKGQRLIKWNAKGPAGPQGPQGVQGPKGDQGPAGPADWNAIPNIPAGFADGVDDKGVTGVRLTYKWATGTTIANGKDGGSVAFCPAGSKVTGGGFYWEYISGFDLTKSYADTQDSWYVVGVNTSGAAGTVYAYAVCMSVEPTGAITTAKVKVAKKMGR